MAPKLSEHLGKHYRELILAVNNIPSILGDDVGPTAAMRTNHAVQNGTKNQRYSCDTRPAKCRFFLSPCMVLKLSEHPGKRFGELLLAVSEHIIILNDDLPRCGPTFLHRID